MVVHAQLPPNWPKPTLCGRPIGKRSTGSYDDAAVTCKRCLLWLSVTANPWEVTDEEYRQPLYARATGAKRKDRAAALLSRQEEE